MKKKATARKRDIAVLHGPTDDGQGARVLRFRDGKVSAGELRPVREGQPLGQSELVRLRRLHGEHSELPVCEVEVLHAPAQADGTEAASTSESAAEPAAEPARSGAGPARVSTQRYRRNWGAVFGQKGAVASKRDYSVN